MKNRPFFKSGLIGLAVVVVSLILTVIMPTDAPKDAGWFFDANFGL